LAEPGGICVSAPIRNEVHGRLCVSETGTSRPADAALAPAGSKPLIAILPFVNMSGDPDQEYFSDGITEDIITELSRFRDIHVIARNSSFQFRGKNVDVKRPGARGALPGRR
jgi:adenylate cyclase